MRRLATLFVLLAVFSLFTVVSAQEDNTLLVPCGDLSQDDCNILIESDRVMTTLNSASFDMEMEMGIYELEDAPDITFTMNIDGVYTGDWSEFVEVLTPERITAISTEPRAFAAFIQDMMTSFSMDLAMSMALPEELLEPGEPASVDFDMMIVDGIFYFNFDEIKRQVPPEEAAELPDGWVGYDFARWMSAFAGIGMALEDQEMVLDEIEHIMISNQFVEVTRLDDEEAADGATLAVFTFDYDMAAMMRSPEYRAYLLESMQQSLDSEFAEPPELTGEGFNLMMDMMATMMDGLSITATSKIGTETFYMYEATFDFTWDSSVVLSQFVGGVRTMIEGAFGEFADPEGPPINSPIMAMRGTIVMDDFNAVEPIAAPPDARVVRIQDLLELMTVAPTE